MGETIVVIKHLQVKNKISITKPCTILKKLNLRWEICIGI